LVGNLRGDQLARTFAALSEGMSLTPAGLVAVYAASAAIEDTDGFDRETDVQSALVEVESFCLDRYPVTNRQYYQFVVRGGYLDMALWEPEIQPLILEFIDQSGQLGPRFWTNGHCTPGLEDHPVVGINWYEAAAFARWTGKRLASDAEWVKAAAWPVAGGDGHPVQRRYPWGDAMDRNRANLWSHGAGTTLPVHDMVAGASVGGVCHLSGNVWEWTAGDFGPDDDEPHRPGQAVRGHIFKSLRGGAFDTYFDAQATCQFQSGDRPLARKHNIGFRCALGVCDLAPPDQAASIVSVAAPAAELVEAGS
jgi:gamma-glutamyl hercynylcysteine S-oxide synthase